MNHIQNSAARNFISAYSNRSLTAAPTQQYTLDSQQSAQTYNTQRQALEGLVAIDETVEDNYFNEPGKVAISYSNALSLKARQDVIRDLEFSQEGTRLQGFEVTRMTNRYEGEADHHMMLSGYELDSTHLNKVSAVPSRDGGITVISTAGTADSITISQYDVPAAELAQWNLAN